MQNEIVAGMLYNIYIYKHICVIYIFIIYIFIYTYIYICVSYIYIYAYICMCFTHIHYIYIYIYVYISISYIYTYMHIYVCVINIFDHYIYTYVYVSISYIYIYAYTYLYEIYAKAIIAARHVFPKRLSLQDMCFKRDYRWHAYFKSIAVHVDFWLKALPLHSPALLCISEYRSIASIAEHRLQWIMLQRQISCSKTWSNSRTQ